MNRVLITLSVILVMGFYVDAYARELIIDSNLKVELIDNTMNNRDADRVFNYAKSSLMGYKKYTEAINAFRSIIDYSSSNLRDDSLYQMGKCQYFLNQNRMYIETFQQVYALFPDGDVVRSGQLSKTLIKVIEKEKLTDFFYIMQAYHLISIVSPNESKNALSIAKDRAKKTVRISSNFGKKYHPNQYKIRFWDNIAKKDFRSGPAIANDSRVNEYIEESIRNEFLRHFSDSSWEYFLQKNQKPRKSPYSYVRKNVGLDCDAAFFDRQTGGIHKYCTFILTTTFQDILRETGMKIIDIAKPVIDEI
jgi:tetratricopeptide (TPR) repeat protein